MKKLLLIFWILILTLLPVSVDAAENQSIIFSGSYSRNNVATDADSAWLFIYYYATFVDSTTVTPEDIQWDGYYQHTHACTNDSTDGWSGIFTFFDDAEVIQINEVATVAAARDSSYALHTQVDSLKDSVEALSANASSQAQVDSLSDTLHVLMHTSDTTAIKAALLYWLDKLTAANNLNNVRYVSTGGDNSNGLTIATAWTSLDSIANLNSPTKILVMPGTYTEVSCTVRTSGLELIGVGGAGITALRGTVDTTAYQDRVIVVNPRDTAIASLRISGFNFAYEVPDETTDPNFKCAIHIQDSVRYVEIDNNLFIADSNFKTIASFDTYVQYLYIHDNMFAGNKVHAIDVAPEYSVISNNYFLKMDSTMNDGVRKAIQFYTKARWNVVEGNFFTTQEVGISMVGADSNLIAGNYLGINDEDASEMSGDVNSVGNVFTGNHGKPHIKLRESAGGDEIGTWEDRFYNMMKIMMMQPPTLSVIPNGDLQLISNAPDSTGVEGWGTNGGGNVYITGRRGFGALPRSLFVGPSSYQNTGNVYLHRGLHEVSAWAWLGLAEDEARISCYDDDDVQQTWADGNALVTGTGYTAWQRIGGTIEILANDYYYFSLGISETDSAYFVGLTVRPSYADVSRISGDSLAAQNFETMLDGTGGQQLTLKRLSIDGANSTNGSFYVSNSTGSATIFTTSATTSAGFSCRATSGDSYGLQFIGYGTGAGIIGAGGTGAGAGMWLIGGTGGHALSLLGSSAGDGIYSSGGANGDGLHLLGQGTGKDLNTTIDLNDMSGDYDKDDYEDDFFETMSDTNRIRLDSLFTQANSLLAMIDGGNELIDLDTLIWIAEMLDTVIDSLLSQGWAAVDACAGAGAYTCTLTVVDTTHDVTVSGVDVTVNNQTEDGTEYPLTSLSSGHAIVSLNDGDYRASALGPPYVYASTDFTISGAALHDSIVGYAPTISSPPSAAVATVYGYFISGGHDTLRNMDVTFELEGYATVIDTASDALVTAKIVRKTTDGNGKVSTSLLKNENLITADGDSLVHPWWTCKAADPTFPFTIHFIIDVDSTTFNLGVESDAVQFRRR